jgi:hypothetical protein
MSEQVEVREFPQCAMCSKPSLAAYDSKTKMGPWGYLCEKHWRSHGVGRLGTGFGQRLVLRKKGG